MTDIILQRPTTLLYRSSNQEAAKQTKKRFIPSQLNFSSMVHIQPQMNFSSHLHAPTQPANDEKMVEESDSDSDEDQYVPEDYNEPEYNVDQGNYKPAEENKTADSNPIEHKTDTLTQLRP